MDDATEIRVLILAEDDPTFSVPERLTEILDERYHSEVTILSDPVKLSEVYYNVLPHLIACDTTFQGMTEKIKRDDSCPNELDTVPFLLLDRNNPKFDLESKGFISVFEKIKAGAGYDEIVEKIENVIDRLGFKLEEGKINERLVQRSLDIELSVDGLEEQVQGVTTGVNRNGLGARLRTENLSREDLEAVVDGSCTVYFVDKDLGFMPAYGKILRIEDSRDDDYDVFVAVRFNPNSGFSSDPGSLDILDSLIESQEEESIRKINQRDRS